MVVEDYILQSDFVDQETTISGEGRYAMRVEGDRVILSRLAYTHVSGARDYTASESEWPVEPNSQSHLLHLSSATPMSTPCTPLDANRWYIPSQTPIQFDPYRILELCSVEAGSSGCELSSVSWNADSLLCAISSSTHPIIILISVDHAKDTGTLIHAFDVGGTLMHICVMLGVPGSVQFHPNRPEILVVGFKEGNVILFDVSPVFELCMPTFDPIPFKHQVLPLTRNLCIAPEAIEASILKYCTVKSIEWCATTNNLHITTDSDVRIFTSRPRQLPSLKDICASALYQAVYIDEDQTPLNEHAVELVREWACQFSWYPHWLI